MRSRIYNLVNKYCDFLITCTTMRNIVVLFVVFASANCALMSESNGTAEDQVDGLKLVELGRKMHKPMLTLIGVAIKNLQSCEWSSWTDCDTKTRGYFGTRTRSRTCVDTSSSEFDKRYNETDIGFCEGHCPLAANLTSHGFCLKLHLTNLNHDDAEKYCEKERGYLINIDSENKYQDVKNMLKDYSPNIHIGGRRKTASSPWVYKYGSQTPIIKWGSGDPDNASTDLCLLYSSGSNLWYDTSCAGSRHFLCEFPKA